MLNSKYKRFGAKKKWTNFSSDSIKIPLKTPENLGGTDTQEVQGTHSH